MSEKRDLLNAFDLIPFSRLSEDWVKSVWDSDFTCCSDIDEDVLSNIDESLLLALDRLCSCINYWITNEKNNEGFWNILMEHEISIKGVVAFLAYLLTVGHKKSADFSQKETAIFAARTYCKIVCVPGSSVFKIFHPELFEKCVDLLKQFIMLGTNKRKKASTAVRSIKTNLHTKSRRKLDTNSVLKENCNSQGHEQNIDDNDIEDDDDTEEELSQIEANVLRQKLHSLLVDIVSFLETVSLQQSLTSAYQSIQILAALTRHGVEQFDGNFKSCMSKSELSIPALAYQGLQAICTQLHGNVSSLMNATCKNLLPNLLMLLGDKAVQAIPKHMQTTKDNAVKFICILLKQCGEHGVTSVRTLLQHMCTKVTDRAEYRTIVAQSVVTIAQELPADSYNKMVQWFYKLSRHNLASNRGFALEIFSVLLASPERKASGCPYTTYKSLLGKLLEQCSDVSPTVRARAIGCFAQCLSSENNYIVCTIKEITSPKPFVYPANMPRLIKTPMAPMTESLRTACDSSASKSGVTIAQRTTEGISTVMESGLAQGQPTPLDWVHLTTGFDLNVSDNEGVFSMLRRRAKDEKLNVRKAALQAIEAIIRFEALNYTKQNVEILRDHCRDPSLSVRKQCLQSLTDLLVSFPQDSFLQRNWLKGALPLVIDRESTSMEKSMQILEELILHNITSKVKSCGEGHRLAWSLLEIIAQTHNIDQRCYLQNACRQWSRQKKIKPALITALQTHIETENNTGAWMLLAEVASAVPKIDPAWLIQYWKDHTNQESYITEKVLIVMKCIANYISADDCGDLIQDLTARLLKVRSATRIDFCDSSHIIKATCQNEDLIVCHLFTLGEVVQLCPGKIHKHIFLLVQSMIATPCIGANYKTTEHSVGIQSSQSSNDAISEDNNSQRSDIHVRKSSQCSQPLTQFKGSQMSSRVRAFAFITLGKLCLQNEDLAMKCIAALARELEITTDHAIKNNVMIIMCDLCVRYTTVANHYISNIVCCLKEPSPLLRKQTLTMIIKLLQEDFIKWKGALFYRLISTLLDEHDEIRKFGEFCLVNILIQRHPNLFFQHFMESVFHFNDYVHHAVYNQFKQSDKDRKLFTLKEHFIKRQTLYKFMLEHMSDDHKFQLQSKLVQEILGAIADGILPIDNDTSAILKDTLAILSCKEIKLSYMKMKPSEEVATDEQEMAAVVIATAKRTIITQVVKKNVMENIVPVVISMKHMFEKQRSPLLNELLMYLRELMKDYKNEVKEILSADHQLATEIEFDLRKLPEQQLPSYQPEPVASNRQGSPVPAGVIQSPVKPSNQMSPTTCIGSHGSPKTPALKLKTPIFQMSTGRAKTAREAVLSTVAVLNSARKFARPDGANILKSMDSSTHTENETPARIVNTSVLGGTRGQPATPVDTLCQTTVPEDTLIPMTKPGGTRGLVSIVHKHIGRAISTPLVNLTRITFQDRNTSFIPFSPIAKNDTMLDILGDEIESTLVLKEKDDDDIQVPHNVLLMDSPLDRVQKPKVWNVTSPAPKKSKRRFPMEIDEGNAIPLTVVNDEAANGNHKDTNKPQRRTSCSNKAKSNLMK